MRNKDNYGEGDDSVVDDLKIRSAVDSLGDSVNKHLHTQVPSTPATKTDSLVGCVAWECHLASPHVTTRSSIVIDGVAVRDREDVVIRETFAGRRLPDEIGDRHLSRNAVVAEVLVGPELPSGTIDPPDAVVERVFVTIGSGAAGGTIVGWVGRDFVAIVVVDVGGDTVKNNGAVDELHADTKVAAVGAGGVAEGRLAGVAVSDDESHDAHQGQEDEHDVVHGCGRG